MARVMVHGCDIATRNNQRGMVSGSLSGRITDDGVGWMFGGWDWSAGVAI